MKQDLYRSLTDYRDGSHFLSPGQNRRLIFNSNMHFFSKTQLFHEATAYK